jgi:hypothetical protein
LALVALIKRFSGAAACLTLSSNSSYVLLINIAKSSGGMQAMDVDKQIICALPDDQLLTGRDIEGLRY